MMNDGGVLMLRVLLTASLIVGGTAAPPAAQGNKAAASFCATVDQALVATIAGGPARPGMTMGPEKDDDTGGISTTCSFVAAGKVVLAIRVEFTSAAEAKKKVTPAFIKDSVAGENTKVTEEKGIGDLAFWAVSDDGASFVMLAGARVFSIGMGGSQKDAVAKKVAMIKLTQTLAGR